MNFKKGTLSFRFLASFMVAMFVGTLVGGDFFRTQQAFAAVVELPTVGTMVALSQTDTKSPLLKGIRINPNNPLDFEFIMDAQASDDISEAQAEKLIKYFMATLTIPQADLWVNLSPYENDRIATDALGFTDLGKDLLEQDYILKQLSASLTHPESETGKEYWKDINGKQMAAIKNTFNKIWIMPDLAEVYENGDSAFITEATLKVMTEADYQALNENAAAQDKTVSSVIKDVLLPKITSDVNSGENFTELRQIYHSMILGLWFKERFMESAFKHYINQNKVSGIDINDKDAKEKIFAQYVESFKKGVYDLTKKEYDVSSMRKVKRNYFSGGFDASSAITNDDGTEAEALENNSNPIIVKASISDSNSRPMTADDFGRTYELETLGGIKGSSALTSSDFTNMSAEKFESLRKEVLGIELNENIALGAIKAEAYEKEADLLTAAFDNTGLKIIARMDGYIDLATAQRHYAEHEGKPFFDGVTNYLSMDKIAVFLFEKTDELKAKDSRPAYDIARELIEDVLRQKRTDKNYTFTNNAGEEFKVIANAVHGSDGFAAVQSERNNLFGNIQQVSQKQMIEEIKKRFNSRILNDELIAKALNNPGETIERGDWTPAGNVQQDDGTTDYEELTVFPSGFVRFAEYTHTNAFGRESTSAKDEQRSSITKLQKAAIAATSASSAIGDLSLTEEIIDELELEESDMTHFNGLTRQIGADKAELKIGEAFLPSALLTDQERTELLGAIDYEEIAEQLEGSTFAKDNVVLTFNPMEGGLGTSVERGEYLADLIEQGKIPARELHPNGLPKEGAKATDLYFNLNLNGKDVVVPIAEIKLLRVLKLASQFNKAVFQPLVNNDSYPSYVKLLNSVYLMDAIDDSIPADQKRTYRQIMEEMDVNMDSENEMLFQKNLPVIDIETGKLRTDEGFTSPGGHGQWGVMLFSMASNFVAKDESKTNIRVFYNGDGPSNGTSKEIAEWMAKENVPSVMISTTKTGIDKKGGQIGIQLMEDGSVRAQMVELAQAKKVGQEKLFYDVGLTPENPDNAVINGKENTPGKQYFNTNTALINFTLMSKLLQGLRALNDVNVDGDMLSGDDLVKRVISPDLILNEKEKGKKKEKVYQVEGAIGSVFLNVNAFFATSNDARVKQILTDNNVDKVLRIVNISSEDRASFFTPNKNAFDAALQTQSDFYTLDTENWVLKDSKAGQLPPVVNLIDYKRNEDGTYKLDDDGNRVDTKYYGSVSNIMNTVGNFEADNLEKLDLTGKVMFQDAILSGTIKVVSEFNGMVDIQNIPGMEFNEEGRLVLKDITINIDAEGEASISSALATIPEINERIEVAAERKDLVALSGIKAELETMIKLAIMNVEAVVKRYDIASAEGIEAMGEAVNNREDLKDTLGILIAAEMDIETAPVVASSSLEELKESLAESQAELDVKIVERTRLINSGAENVDLVIIDAEISSLEERVDVINENLRAKLQMAVEDTGLEQTEINSLIEQNKQLEKELEQIRKLNVAVSERIDSYKDGFREKEEFKVELDDARKELSENGQKREQIKTKIAANKLRIKELQKAVGGIDLQELKVSSAVGSSKIQFKGLDLVKAKGLTFRIIAKSKLDSAQFANMLAQAK